MVFLSSLRAAWPEPVTRDEAIRAAAEIEAFLSTRMTDPNGAVTVNAVRDRPVIAGEARNDDILSETVGQMMELALLRSDREAFALQLKVLNEFIGPSGLAAWKISGTNKAADSATIDDLRIADACFQAARRWPDLGAQAAARAIIKALAAAAADREVLPAALALSDGTGRTAVIPVCYLMPGTLARLAGEDAGIEAIAENALRLSLADRRHSGLPARQYDPVGKKWIHGPCDEQLALITLREVQATDPANPDVLEGIQRRLSDFQRRGHLPESYDSATGEASDGPGGATVHALFARLLLAAGHTDEAARALRVSLGFQTRTPPFAGAIGTAPVFSFDQLEVLLALADFLRVTERGADE
jgi:hypothetical protein